MRAAGYDQPVRGALVVTGLLRVLMAPLLNHGLTLAAITKSLEFGSSRPSLPPRPAEEGENHNAPPARGWQGVVILWSQQLRKARAIASARAWREIPAQVRPAGSGASGKHAASSALICTESCTRGMSGRIWPMVVSTNTT